MSKGFTGSSHLSLTTGVNNFTGTSGNDTFSADETDGTVMISTADKLDGGNGTDTLDIYTDGTVFALGQLTSIETLNVYDLDANHTIATNNFASVTTVNLVRGDGEVDLTVGANVATIGLTDMAVDTSMGLILDADATAITLNVTDLTGATGDDVAFTGADLDEVTVNVLTDSEFGTLNVAAASSITINATGDLTLADDVTTTATDATITITGAGAVDLGVLDDGVTTFVATANTGGVTVTGPADSADASITLSAGNDVFTTSDNGFATADEFAVNAGAGTADVLVVAATADVDAANEGGRYTNFEIIRSGDSVNMARIAGINSLQITGGTSETYSGMTATQAANVTFRGNNTTSTIFTLADATGTADVLSVNLTHATTATTNVDVIGISAIGIETVNINSTTGTDGTQSDFGFLANSADSVSAINITGSADVRINQVANTFDVVAVDIDASGLTGDGNLIITGGVFIAGSSVTGSNNDDTVVLSTTLGTTYTMGAGDDSVTAVVATLVADGTDDTVLNGGNGDDTLTITTAAATLTDNHFTNVSNMEALVTAGVGATSVTTGAGFNAAFATGVTVTTGALGATVGYTLAAGLANMAMDVTVSGDLILGDDAAESIAVTTGSGADTVVVNAAGFVSDIATTGTITVSTGAGADDITVTTGTLVDDANATPITIDAGTGKDTITITKVNGDAAVTLFAKATFTVDAGDSNVTTYDEITGFAISDGDLLSDTLDFTGDSAAGTLATSTNFGTILSHSLTTGVAEFDDAAAFDTALVIDASNLADVVGYLAANTATLDTVAFEFDEDGDGTADATMVYNNNTTDSLVLLAGLTGVVSLTGTSAATTGLLHID
jgi:hypothetical protein